MEQTILISSDGEVFSWIWEEWIGGNTSECVHTCMSSALLSIHFFQWSLEWTHDSSLLQKDKETTWTASGKMTDRSIKGKLSWNLKAIYFLAFSPANDCGERKVVSSQQKKIQLRRKRNSLAPFLEATVESKLSERGEHGARA